MREIKFRAWDKADKQIYEVDTLGGEMSVWKRELPDGDWNIETSPRERYELMQYTGLKDKNGKEIYEGDVLQTFRGLAKVGFNHGCFVLWYGGVKNWKIIDRTYLVNHGGADSHEVIGNVFENPELFAKPQEA